MIQITPTIFLEESELKFSFIRAPGPGGQNVNKVATAVQLRFNVFYSPSLPEVVRQRLQTLLQAKLTLEGDIIIKASRYRTQSRNKEDAIERLVALIKPATIMPKKRKKTKPSKATTQRRIEKKKLHGYKKNLRQSHPKNDF